MPSPLTFAVNAAILPILLVHFHLFPLLSLLYNLFFPLAVGIALSSPSPRPRLPMPHSLPRLPPLYCDLLVHL